MSDETFEILSQHEDVPFRLKNNFGGYISFRSERGRVLVRPGLMPRLQASAAAAMPLETGGLLVGRIFRDDIGRYATVVGFVEAPKGTGTAGHISMPSEMVADLKRQAAREHPTSDVIGWWHSHLGESRYSPTDKKTQSTWTDPENVGILVFGSYDKTIGIVHQGPEAVICHVDGQIAGEDAFPAQQPPPGEPAVRPQQPARPEPLPPNPLNQFGARPRTNPLSQLPMARRRSGPAAGGTPVGAVRLLFVVVVVMVMVLLTIMVMINSLSRKVDRRVPQWQNGDAATWFCISQSPARPWVYDCAARVGSPGVLHWISAGREVATGPTVAVTVDPGGRVDVALVVSDSTGSHQLGDQILEYVSAPSPTIATAAVTSLPPVFRPHG